MARNIFEGNQCTVRDIPALIQFAKRTNRALLLLAGPGIGKSEAVKQCADAMFGASDHNLVDVRLADKEPSDVNGLPVPVTGEDGKTRTVFALPSFWPDDPDWEGVVFLDELSHAEPYLQKVAFQILLDHRIGEYKFPKGAVFVCAGNRSTDGTQVAQLEAPLANRLIIVELLYDAESWLEDYALQHGVHSSIIGYLSQQPSSIENYDKMEEAGCPAFATPRSWVAASDVLKDYDAGLINSRLCKVLLQGVIGSVMMHEIYTYHDKKRNLTPIKDIMSGKVKEHQGKKTPDISWIIGSEGCTFLRNAVQNADYTDEDIVGFAANFLEYLHSNFAEDNRDFCLSVFMNLISKNVFGKAILIGCGNREKLVAKLINKYPVAVQILKEYEELYKEALADLR